MSRPRKSIPEYLLHKPSGQAYVRITRADGRREPVYLGAHGSSASRREYARVISELEVGAAGGRPARITINAILIKYLLWAATHYRRPDGTPTNELDEMKRSVAPLSELYGTLPAAEFGPLALKAVRASMLKSGWCRTLINKRIARIRRVFKWAAAEELAPVTVHQALATVPGLQRGRCTARETEPVGPVDPAHVEIVKARVLPEVRTMIAVQELAAMRPQDVCNLTPGAIDRTGDIWIYRPKEHKGQWRGKERVVMIGPKAQVLLAPYLADLGDDEHVFSPARAVAAYRERRRAGRKSRVQPSQSDRSKPRPQRSPGPKYTGQAYAHAIAKACAKADIECWGPNRLRHSAATEIRKRFGLEAAQAALGHDKADVTQVYAARNQQLAAKVAMEMG